MEVTLSKWFLLPFEKGLLDSFVTGVFYNLFFSHFSKEKSYNLFIFCRKIERKKISRLFYNKG